MKQLDPITLKMIKVPPQKKKFILTQSDAVASPASATTTKKSDPATPVTKDMIYAQEMANKFMAALSESEQRRMKLLSAMLAAELVYNSKSKS